MRSSTSSSDAVRDPYARDTAADRPGVAQPVPLRPVPAHPWGRILIVMLVLSALLLAGWEAYWRAFGVTPSIRNTARPVGDPAAPHRRRRGRRHGAAGSLTHLLRSAAAGVATPGGPGSHPAVLSGDFPDGGGGSGARIRTSPVSC